MVSHTTSTITPKILEATYSMAKIFETPRQFDGGFSSSEAAEDFCEQNCLHDRQAPIRTLGVG
jgi:hypothetical protein